MTDAVVGLSWSVALASMGTIVLAVLRRWELTRTFAKVTTFGGVTLMVGLPIVIVFGAFGISNADASSRATQLGRGISEAMNCGALGVPALLIGPLCWWLAARKTKKIH